MSNSSDTISRDNIRAHIYAPSHCTTANPLPADSPRKRAQLGSEEGAGTSPHFKHAQLGVVTANKAYGCLSELYGTFILPQPPLHLAELVRLWLGEEGFAGQAVPHTGKLPAVHTTTSAAALVYPHLY